MSNNAVGLRHQIATAGDLESVVRTMKALAASSISQYENAVHSLDDYDQTVQLGLLACFRQRRSGIPGRMQYRNEVKVAAIGAVVFGTDHGLVGQFNDHLVSFVVETLNHLPGKKTVWAIGQRIRARFEETLLDIGPALPLPGSISAITLLIGQVLEEVESQRTNGEIGQVYLFHNRPISGSGYEPVHQRLLPMDASWQRELANRHWPTKQLPEVMGDGENTLRAFVREYLFVSLFRACAESLASENASRLAAMQRAETNINELLEVLNGDFHRLRQSAIDEELFDVVSGFEAFSVPKGLTSVV